MIANGQTFKFQNRTYTVVTELREAEWGGTFYGKAKIANRTVGVGFYMDGEQLKARIGKNIGTVEIV